jgi:uncharacterized protein
MQSNDVLKETHNIEVDGRRFVYDVNELLILEVDDATWEYFEAAVDPSGPPPAARVAARFGPDVAADVVAQLRDAGLLVPAGDAHERLPPRRTGMLGVTLDVTHGCNLRCTYCFAEQGDYGLGRANMPEETARRAIDWLAERGDGEQGARVGFFGGEPLMNMPTVRSTVAYVNERLASGGKRVRLHVTTNGTLLNEGNVQYLAENKIDVQVSVDGTPKTHNKFRLFPSGRGSHDVVAGGIARLKSATGSAVLRATISPGEGDFRRSVDHLIDDLGGTVVAFEPASKSSCGPSIDADDMARIKSEWDAVAEDFAEHIKRGVVKPVGNIIKLLQAIHRRKKTVYGCTAGYANVAVDPSGDIYPCHRFVGEGDWKMGNVHSGEFDEGLRERFARNTVDQREPCRTCWARYTCGGRCAHEALESTGTIDAPDPLRCELVRHLTELSIKLYVQLKPYEQELLAKASA